MSAEWAWKSFRCIDDLLNVITDKGGVTDGTEWKDECIAFLSLHLINLLGVTALQGLQIEEVRSETPPF